MADPDAVHDELSRRRATHDRHFRTAEDPATGTALLGASTPEYPDGQMFASVKKGRRCVSDHLMSVYLDPDALDDLGPELRGMLAHA